MTDMRHKDADLIGAEPPMRDSVRIVRFRMLSAICLMLVGVVGATLAGGYYLALSLTVQSSLNFVPLAGFATVAAYRVFHDSGLPLPMITSGNGQEGPPCFTAGEPTPNLAASSPCSLPLNRVGSPGSLPCSTWKREVCNVVQIPSALYRNDAFQSILSDYVTSPCRFLSDYRQLQAPLAQASTSIARAGYYANTIDLDFRCTSEESAMANVPSARSLWPRLRPHLLVEDDIGQTASVVELRISPPLVR